MFYFTYIFESRVARLYKYYKLKTGVGTVLGLFIISDFDFGFY